MNSSRQKSIGAKDVRFDLSCFYKSISDPQIDKDFEDITVLCKSLHSEHKGKLGSTLEDALKKYTDIETLSNKIFVYLSLRKSTDQRDEVVKTKLEGLSEKFDALAGEYLTFFNLEIKDLDQKVIERQYKNSSFVLHHKPLIEDIVRDKPYFLSEEVESALTKRGVTGPRSWSKYFNEVESELRFNFSGEDGEIEEVTLEKITSILSENTNSDVRAKALEVLNNGLKKNLLKLSAQTLNIVAASLRIENAERGYTHPMEPRNRENKMSSEVVEALHAAVTKTAAPLARRFYCLKAAHLGLKKLRWSDRNANIPFTDSSKIPFDKALKTVLAAYKSFSPTLADLIQKEIVAKGRIDAPSVNGKESGAYSSSFILPDQNASFVFLNYLGSNRDVMTLAHELGHSAHGLLAEEAQGALQHNAPMNIAETASVFGEMTTFNFLVKQLEESGDKESLLALIMGKIDDMVNTSVRQIGFSNFERRVHGAGKRLSMDEMNAIWMETARELYGEDGDVFTYENTDSMWSYVPHFHRPFYVYAYACGELLTQSLYAKQDTFGKDFEPLYLDLLRAGGTKSMEELILPFGLDAKDPTFWSNGIELSLGKLVEKAEELSRELGIVPTK